MEWKRACDGATEEGVRRARRKELAIGAKKATRDQGHSSLLVCESIVPLTANLCGGARQGAA
eukprot:6172578-Pleurochrysis_carterae.AAC.1